MPKNWPNILLLLNRWHLKFAFEHCIKVFFASLEGPLTLILNLGTLDDIVRRIESVDHNSHIVTLAKTVIPCSIVVVAGYDS